MEKIVIMIGFDVVFRHLVGFVVFVVLAIMSFAGEAELGGYITSFSRFVCAGK